MRKVLIAVVMAMVMLGDVGAAQGKADYRPEKRALERAWQIYDSRYWVPTLAQNGLWPQGNDRMGISAPAEFSLKTKSWGDGACAMGTLVTALWGQVPNGEWGPQMRAFLRPFMASKNPPTATLPVPTVLWLYPDTVIRP